jgi:hypothetical protein
MRYVSHPTNLKYWFTHYWETSLLEIVKYKAADDLTKAFAMVLVPLSGQSNLSGQSL